MKSIILILMLIPIISFSQKREIIKYSLIFFGGAFDGISETQAFHNERIFKRFPNASKRFWGKNSWANKYKNGDPSQGEKFPFSSTVLVSFTDGYHLMRFGKSASFGAALTIRLSDNKKRNWKDFLAELLGTFIAKSAGFHLTYSYLFKP